MVYDWGMSKKIGFFSLGSQSQLFIGRDYQTKNDFSEKLAAVADDEMMAILDSNYKRATKVLTQKIDILHEMAKLLLERETIYKEEVDMIMEGKKTEEVLAYIQKKEKEQKERDAQVKEERAKQEKLALYEKKIAEGQNFVKLGVISQEELDSVVQEYQKYKQSLEKPAAEPAKPAKPRTPRKTTQTEKTTENKPKTRKTAVARKKTDKSEDNK